MSRSVKIGQLADAVAEELEAYSRLAADDMKKAVKAAGKTVSEQIKDTAPARTGKYAKSWTSKVMEERSTGISVTVYSPSRYMLAHLLEHGHAKRGGGRTQAFPHIAPAEQAAEDKLEADIRKALEG